MVRSNPFFRHGHHSGWHTRIDDHAVQVNDGFAVGMQNMGVNRRVLKTVHTDSEFACFVNRTQGSDYREYYSLELIELIGVRFQLNSYFSKPSR